jgi:capsular exopolysaccharide synthesis family protein
MAQTPQTRQSFGGTKHPTEYLRIFYKRRWVAVPAFLLVFLSGAVDSVRTVPIYEARTQLLIEKESRRATSLTSVLDERDSWYEDDFYPTQQRILQSRQIAERTAKELAGSYRPEQIPTQGMSFSLGSLFQLGVSKVTGLVRGDTAPAPPAATVTEAIEQRMAPAVGRLMGGLTVTPIRNSRMVDLKFRSPDAEYAAKAVNEIANQYIKQSVELRFGAAQAANAWLKDQLEEQRKKVEESERKLQAYKEQNNAIALDDKQNIVVQRLGDISRQVTNAKIERMAREADYQGVLELQRTGGDLASYPAIAADDFINKLKTDLVARQAEKADLVAKGFGPNYTPMRQVDSQIQTLQEQLSREIGRKVEGVRAAFETARLNEANLERALNAQKGESLGLDRKAIEYSELERQAQSDRELYQNLLTRTSETGVSSEYKGTSIQVIDPAQTPAGPVLPQVPRDLMMSALGGLVLAVCVAFGVEYFDSRIKSPDEAKQHLGIPFLGMVPAVKLKDDSGDSPMLTNDAPPAFGEAIRAIRTAVLFSSAEDGARSIVITSTGPSEGKTMISSSLAISLAQTGQRTLVIDADMRRPRLHDALGRSQEPGLSNVLVGETSLADAARPTSIENLSLLSAGHIPPNPAELLGSKKYLELLNDLKKKYDWIVIDAPPVMPVTDAAVVANTAGGVLFVVGAEMTPRQTAATAIEQLRSAHAKFIGVVLNKVNVTRHSYYYAPYYRKEYGKYYQRSPNRA